MPNTVQLTQNGQPVYPVTDVSLITGLEERSGMRVIPYTTRPTASAETAGFIYMDESTKDLYITKATSGSYSWVSAGNLSNINLDNYATKDEVSQLGQEVDVINNDRVKKVFSGYFIGNGSAYETSVSLPTTEVKKNRLYILALDDPNYARNNTGTTSNQQIFALKYELNGTATNLILYYRADTAQIPAQIPFIITKDFDTVQIGGRANSGVKVSWSIYDITESLDKKLGDNETVIPHNAITRRHLTAQAISSVNGTRVSIVFPVLVGDVFSSTIISGYKFVAQVWDTFQNALISPGVDTGLKYQTLTRDGYTTLLNDTEITASGFLIIKIEKDDTTAFTDAQMAAALAGLSISWKHGIFLNVDSLPDLFYYRIDSSLSKLSYGPLRHAAGSSSPSASGTRLSIGCDIKKGQYITFSCSDSDTLVVAEIWDTWNHAVVSPGPYTERRQAIASYTQNTIKSWTTADGVLIFKFKLSNDAAISDAKVQAILNGISYKIEGEIPGKVATLETGLASLQSVVDEIVATNTAVESARHLYLGPLVQYALDSNGNIGSSSTTAVSQASAIAVPYYGCKVNVKLPEGYCVKFKDGESTTSMAIVLSNDSGWLVDGDSYTFADSHHQIFRACFGKNSGADNVTVSEIQTLINALSIELTYEDYSNDIVLSNAENEKNAKMMMRKFTGVLLNDIGLDKMPMFTHISDTHGDAIRTGNFLRYSDFLGVDAAIITGDVVPMDGAKDRVDYLNDLIDKHKTTTLLCMGNHDAREGSTKEIQNRILAHTIDKYSLSTPSGEDYPTYFYYDIAAKSIRVISFNQWMPGQRDTNTWHYTQDQIDWLIATLASTPSGYGVIIIMHDPEGTITKDTSHAKFFQALDNGSGGTYIDYYPITKIVDAFISKTTLSGTFEDPRPSSATDTITVSADFTSVASGVEFICYLNGHHHKDRIGYSAAATNKQLVCNIALGFALYGNSTYKYYAEESDLPRGGVGATQDSFNLYCVDRTAGTLRIARIGSNMNADGDKRDWMIIPYKD